MTFPKISIITPTFNQGAFIKETILSVLQQGYPNLEFIIVDAGSSDGTLEIIKGFDEKLVYWCSRPDEGMYDGLQYGFERSSGDIMTWINSDDVLTVGSLFTVAEIFSTHADINWLSGLPNQIDEKGKNIGVGGIPRWNKYRYMQHDFRYIQQEGTFWRRSLWEQAGGYIDKRLQLAGDLELWSRFFQHAELYFVNCILGAHRFRSKDQFSLEHLGAYDKEAESILQQMPMTKREESYLRKVNSLFWRLTRRRPLLFLARLMGHDKVHDEVFKPNPVLYYDRSSASFVLSASGIIK